MPAYVTPNDPSVKALLSNILAQHQASTSVFDLLRDWVASNINYYLHPNVDAYWQLPSETLALRNGSCIAYSTLLCSLLRSDGVPADQVYVAIAYKKNTPQRPATCHAFLVGKYQTGLWTVIEPQCDAAVGQSGADWNDFATYDIVYCVNDMGYFKGSPSLYSPNVKIQSVTLPSNVKANSGFYSTTFRLVNNESVGLIITWQSHSSVTGNFDSGSIVVPKNGYVDVTRSYYYTVAGAVNLTYTIYHNGNQIDTWSGTMNVLP
jgi:hypothetical protein